MNWILATVGVLFLICIIVGILKGAIKIAVSIGATILTFILVFILTPFVSKGIASLTPLDDMIENQVVKTVANVATSTVDSKSQGLTKDAVKRVMEAAGITESDLAAVGISVDDIVNGKISGQDLAQYGISSRLLDGLNVSDEQLEEAVEGAEIPRDMQIAAIESADLPDVFKNLLLTNNNSEIYNSLGVSTFVQYLAKYLAKLIINIVSFLIVFVIVTIILRAIIFALDIVSELPVLGFVNRLAGGLAGAIGALVIVWVLFIIITLLYTTDFGKDAYGLIQDNDFLRIIYEYNPVMKLATTLR